MKYKITYHYDALCGWCYGFSNVMEKIFQKYRSDFEFDVISGGLFKEERVGYINDIAPYIKSGAYKNVEERTGVLFGKQFLKEAITNNNIYLDSLPPAIALAMVKKLYPKKKMEYAHELLKAFYFEGRSTDDWTVYKDIAKKLNISIKDFAFEIKKLEYLEDAKNEFNLSSASDANGFPSLTLTAGLQNIVLSNGYVDFEVIDEKLTQIIEMIKSR